MATEVRIYDPTLVSVIIGSQAITGFAEGTFVTAGYEENAIDYTQGLANGAVTLNPSREGNLKFTLLQSSSSNAYLQIYASRLRDRRGVFYFPFLVINNSGGELASGDAAWIIKEPEVSLADKMLSREWVIKTGRLTLKHNSNYILMTAASAQVPS